MSDQLGIFRDYPLIARTCGAAFTHRAAPILTASLRTSDKTRTSEAQEVGMESAGHAC
jgi:hypothetical protein